MCFCRCCLCCPFQCAIAIYTMIIATVDLISLSYWLEKAFCQTATFQGFYDKKFRSYGKLHCNDSYESNYTIFDNALIFGKTGSDLRGILIIWTVMASIWNLAGALLLVGHFVLKKHDSFKNLLIFLTPWLAVTLIVIMLDFLFLLVILGRYGSNPSRYFMQLLSMNIPMPQRMKSKNDWNITRFKLSHVFFKLVTYAIGGCGMHRNIRIMIMRIWDARLGENESKRMEK